MGALMEAPARTGREEDRTHRVGRPPRARSVLDVAFPALIAGQVGGAVWTREPSGCHGHRPVGAHGIHCTSRGVPAFLLARVLAEFNANLGSHELAASLPYGLFAMTRTDRTAPITPTP